MTESRNSFVSFPHAGLALDPIHIGTGGSRLGRVDNPVVRDPVTRIPKLPGSSLAGVMRAYAAMVKGKYPACSGQGGEPESGHCGDHNCPICVTFGFTKGDRGGFAGLAAFSDAHVLLFPVATGQGPMWMGSPASLRMIEELKGFPHLSEDAVFQVDGNGHKSQRINMGWLLLPAKTLDNDSSAIEPAFETLGINDYIKKKLCVVPDKLFSYIVNSNLEIRTSVSINPETGAAEDGALFTYEALPRGTVLYWDITCRHPAHFKIGGTAITGATTPEAIHDIVTSAHSHLEHLGIGGMSTRGMGRLRVLASADNKDGEESQ